MSKRLTALIPAHNDDYTLDFCLHSIVDHFDEIIVLDDCSSDHTADIALDVAKRYKHVRFLRHESTAALGGQLGWIEARNRLLAETDSDLLFWLDSDDVLCEYNAHLLREIAEGDKPVVRLQLCEMWGDFCHTTQRLRHYDRCHVFVNRRKVQDLLWGGGTGAKLHHGYQAVNGPGPLFFHIKGVKPDRRLVERQFMRKWLRAGARGRLEDFAGLDRLSEEETHRRAIHMLLHSRQDKLVPSYLPPRLHPGLPDRPRIIRDAPVRFRIVYSDLVDPADRLDLGWTPIAWRAGDAS